MSNAHTYTVHKVEGRCAALEHLDYDFDYWVALDPESGDIVETADTLAALERKLVAIGGA